MKKNNNNSIIKTTTLSAQVAITKTESGMDYMRADMPEILRKGIKKIINHLKKKGLSL